MIRKPCVAGQFYPDDPKSLKRAVLGYLGESQGEPALAVIAPHAGYIYSGATAGSVFSKVAIPNSVILIGPNHTGIGAPASVMTGGLWRIPTGDISINEPLALKLLESSPYLSRDDSAHIKEHSLEVQLPFLLALNPQVSIVPLTLAPGSYKECLEIGTAIAGVIKEFDEDVLIVASSDMNHYESIDITKEKDTLAIDKVLALDPAGLLEVTSSHKITMCGVVPSAIALVAAKALGAKDAILTQHTTSGETSGDYDAVVGYAGFVIR